MRRAAAAGAAAALFTSARASEMGLDAKRVYNYLIAPGCLALVWLFVPLTVIRRSSVRTACYIAALAAGMISVFACLAGVVLGGPKWQTLPTAAFIMLVVGRVGLRGGGRRLLKRTKEAEDSGTIPVASVDSSGRWVPETPREIVVEMVAAAGLHRDHLRAGDLPDIDAAAVSALVWRSLWKPNKQNDADAEDIEDAEQLIEPEPYEAPGSAILASVGIRDAWVPLLVVALSESKRASGMHAALHIVFAALWWVGMVLSAMAKTGFLRMGMTMDGEVGGNASIRTGGIWLQTLLLVLAVFSFPRTRRVVRFEEKKSLHAFAALEAVMSLGMGAVSFVWGREQNVNGNNVAYAVSLVVAATSAALWSAIAVCAYVAAVRRVESSWTRGGDDGRVLAYMAAVVTRPRHGYVQGRAALLWGRPGPDGTAPLAVVLDAGVAGANAGMEEAAYCGSEKLE